MANVNRPFGFRPDRYIGGAPWTGEQVLYAFSASNSTGPAFNGDVVQFDDTNRTLALTDNYFPACPLVKPVVAAVTTTAIRGVIVGFVPEPEYSMSGTTSLGLMYRLDDTKRYVWIVDSPLVVFEVQEDGNDYVTAADNSINKVADIAYTTGNTLTGQSKAEWDSSDATTGSARPFKALRYTPRVDNFNFSASDSLSYAHLDVMIVNSDLTQGNTGL